MALLNINRRIQLRKNKVRTLDLFISRNRADGRRNAKKRFKLLQQQLRAILEENSIKPSKFLRIHCSPVSNNGFTEIIICNVKTNFKKILYCVLEVILAIAVIFRFFDGRLNRLNVVAEDSGLPNVSIQILSQNSKRTNQTQPKNFIGKWIKKKKSEHVFEQSNLVSVSNSTSLIPQFGRRALPQITGTSSSSVKSKDFSTSVFRKQQIVEDNYLGKQQLLLTFAVEDLGGPLNPRNAPIVQVIKGLRAGDLSLTEKIALLIMGAIGYSMLQQVQIEVPPAIQDLFPKVVEESKKPFPKLGTDAFSLKELRLRRIQELQNSKPALRPSSRVNFVGSAVEEESSTQLSVVKPSGMSQAEFDAMTPLEKRLYCEHEASIILESTTGKQHHFNFNQMKHKGGHHKENFGITSPGRNKLTDEETVHMLNILKNAAQDLDNVVWFEQDDATYLGGTDRSQSANFMFEKRERRVTVFLQTPKGSHGLSSFVLGHPELDRNGDFSVNDLYYNHNVGGPWDRFKQSEYKEYKELPVPQEMLPVSQAPDPFIRDVVQPMDPNLNNTSPCE